MLVKKLLAPIRNALEHRYFPMAIALLAFVVSLPAVRCDLFFDDLIHRVILIDADRLPEGLHEVGLAPEKPGTLRTALFGQFGFTNDPEAVRQAVEYGAWPWWTPPQLKASLWRPVSSFTHWLDYRLFPDSPPAMHVHSLLWFSAVALLIATVYRRLLGPTWIAGMAAVMYVIDENNFMPVMFIANRNALIALFFGLLSVLAHHRWRRFHSRPAAVAAPLLFLLALLSAEAGLATFAYLFAYAVALERGPVAKRALSLAPTFCVIVLWRIVYNALGYGVANVGIYVDPVNDPVRYALALVERAPLMLTGLLTPLSPDVPYFLSAAVRAKFFIGALAVLVLAFAALVPLLRVSRVARYWLIAMVCAVTPFCATWASGRNLLFPAVAAFALIAMFVGQLLGRASWIPRAGPCRIGVWVVGVLLLLAHLPQAALGRLVAVRMTTTMMSALTASGDLYRGAEPNKDVIVLNSHCPLAIAHIPSARLREGLLPPRSVRVLAPGFRPIEVLRTGPNTLLLTAQGGDFFSFDDLGPMHLAYILKIFNELFRGDDMGFQVGDAVTLRQLKAQVTALSQDNMPAQVAFTFTVSLDDESLAWYWFDWRTFRYFTFEPPPVGEKIELPGPSTAQLKHVVSFFRKRR